MIESLLFFFCPRELFLALHLDVWEICWLWLVLGVIYIEGAHAGEYQVYVMDHFVPSCDISIDALNTSCRSTFGRNCHMRYP